MSLRAFEMRRTVRSSPPKRLSPPVCTISKLRGNYGSRLSQWLTLQRRGFFSRLRTRRRLWSVKPNSYALSTPLLTRCLRPEITTPRCVHPEPYLRWPEPLRSTIACVPSSRGWSDVRVTRHLRQQEGSPHQHATQSRRRRYQCGNWTCWRLPDRVSQMHELRLDSSSATRR